MILNDLNPLGWPGQIFLQTKMQCKYDPNPDKPGFQTLQNVLFLGHFLTSLDRLFKKFKQSRLAKNV